MPTDTLTDSKCKAAKAKDKAYKLFDGGGLHLNVSPTGAKTWRLAYRLGGKPQTMSFGPYPDVGLAEARKKRGDAKAVLRDGGDPMAPRKARKTPTLRDACEDFWAGRQDISESYRTNALNCLRTHVFPDLGDRPIGTVTKADLMEPLNRMNAKGHFDYVRKCRVWLMPVFERAIENEECTANPAAMIKPDAAFGKRERESFAAVDLHEVGPLLERLALEDQNMQSVLACRFLAYTWVRTTEMRMMLWSEIVQPDTWLIPAGRMKRSRDHLVPLPTQAREILRKMQARERGSRFVFPGGQSLERPMSENAVLYLLGRIGYQGKMTGHGWRSVGSTWANENGWNPDAVEMQLSHAEGNKTRGVYNRAKYLEERREMLQSWADWLDAQGTSM